MGKEVISQEDKKKIIEKLPVICTRNLVMFPGIDSVLEVGRAKSVNAVTLAQEKTGGYLVCFCQKIPDTELPTLDDIYHVGLLARIKTVRNNNDGSMHVVVEGFNRIKLAELEIGEKLDKASFDILDSVFGDKNTEVALVRNLAKEIEKLASGNNPDVAQSLMRHLSDSVNADTLADTISSIIMTSIDKKQKLLEELDVNKRLEKLIEIMGEEQVISNIENEISKKVRDRIDENQREYVLREKLKTIKEELGDTPNKEDDTESIRKRLESNPYPENVKNKVLDELHRYEMMPPASSEASIIWTYIDWVMNVPWWQKSEDNDDLHNVEKVLDDDHFGLKEPKQRIIEYLAVKKLTSSLKAPIICFSGPPGTGKTSLANSIARALNRKFVKVSLGGVSDESEIRGHRRTYLGSMPGRIIQGMKRAGVINPVFLLDEIDKLGADYKGDPSDALLEVLDPEQNKAFSDNYLEESYDLSNVLFVATANYLANIPAPLKDRLEIIELSSYTEEEKLQIALDHLVKKQIEANGLKNSQISFTKEGILYIIRYYTREAGVRNLERAIGNICRKVGVKIVKGEYKKKEKITEEEVNKYLGVEKFDYTHKEKKPQVGVTTGLAYTEYGGDILPIEVVLFPGKGNLVITGNLGNVMKESASIAIGHVKANAKKYGIDSKKFEKFDIHIHCPEGAIPKDGPSAGVTITTTLVSALTDKPVLQDIAMTGEVTLRGNVLPIGGLKEKSIAAHRSGIKTIYIPKENERDLKDIPESIRKELNVVLVSHVSEIIKKVLKSGK